MRFSSHISCLAGLFVGWLCMLCSSQEIIAPLSVAAGPYPKLPDVVGCAPQYGENLDTHACYQALQTMPDGPRFMQFVSRKSYHGQSALITPVYYYNNKSESLNRSDIDRDFNLFRQMSLLSEKVLLKSKRITRQLHSTSIRVFMRYHGRLGRSIYHRHQCPY